jgi:DNA-nicking Smr family endonuclease
VVRSTHEDAEAEGDEPPEIDLHGLNPEQALRRLGRELHACRVRRSPELLVITGAGFGNALHQPILRGRVAAWLDGPDGKRLGVLGHAVTSRGGALLVRLRTDGDPGR